jgi:hypothetical protein
MRVQVWCQVHSKAMQWQLDRSVGSKSDWTNHKTLRFHCGSESTAGWRQVQHAFRTGRGWMKHTGLNQTDWEAEVETASTSETGAIEIDMVKL